MQISCSAAQLLKLEFVKATLTAGDVQESTPFLTTTAPVVRPIQPIISYLHPPRSMAWLGLCRALVKMFGLYLIQFPGDSRADYEA